MSWPHVFSALQTALMSYLDDNFNAAAQLGTAVNFSGIGGTTPGTGVFTSVQGGIVSQAGTGGAVSGNLMHVYWDGTRATTWVDTASLCQSVGTGDGADAIIATMTTSNALYSEFLYETAGYFHFFRYGASTSVGSITTNGTSTAYNTASDASLKAIHGAGDGTVLSALPVRDASFLTNPAVRHPMIVAQECAAVAPWAVRVPPAGSSDPCMIDHGALVPALLAYVQSLEGRIKELEARAGTPAPAPSAGCAAATSAVAAVAASRPIQDAIARGNPVTGGIVGKAVVSSAP